MPSVTIIDYDCGNLFGMRRALEMCGADVKLADTPEKVVSADRLVLPGVGAFGDAITALRRDGIDSAVCDFAASGKPFLGICVGMQVLFDESGEFGSHRGLGLLGGKVSRIPDTGLDGTPHRVPHIGWNEVAPPDENRTRQDTLFYGIQLPIFTYFVHSYTAVPTQERDRLADSDYNGRRICAAVRRDNIWGCQFHPERSGPIGLRMLGNFMCRD
jgi:glutamine amidotransferase